MPRSAQFDARQALEQAMQQFWRYGYHATTMQDLVDVMGINRASMYNTYGDKHALFLQALELYQQQLRHDQLKPLQDKQPALQRIHALFQNILTNAKTLKGKNGCLLVNTALEMAPHDKAIQDEVMKGQNSIRYFFISALQDGIYKKEVREDIDVNAEAQFLLTLYTGLQVQVRNCRDQQSLHLLLQSLDTYLQTLHRH